MNANERIAEWLEDATINGNLVVVGDDGIPYLETPDGAYAGEFDPSSDHAFWHGDDGLLAKIEERFLLARFTEGVCSQLELVLELDEEDGSQWLQLEYACGLLKATPAQLAAALAEVIGDEN